MPDAVATIRSEMQDEIAEVVDAGAAKIEAAGGTVVTKCRNGHCLGIEASPSEVETIANLSEIARMDLPVETTDASVDSDGRLVNEIYQTQQFWDAGYDGENGAAPSMYFGILEKGGYNTEHYGYTENNGGSSRVASMWDCTETACSTVSGWADVDESFHATRAAGTVFGDLTDNQQSGLTNEEEEARSGIAREAWGHLYKTVDGSSGSRQMYDSVADRASKPMVVSSSIPSKADQSCDGESTRDKDVDDLLYEQGILLIVAAGNDGQSSTDCRVWAPGAAAGAFTVGGYGLENLATAFSDECAARTATVNSLSSSGGCQGVSCYAEGKYRTVIDVLGLYRATLRTEVPGVDDYFQFGGTSHAAPSVAGAAIAFHDMWTQEHSSFMDYNPGYMAVWLLAMGDRYSGLSGFDISSRFDNYSGAGRLRMRSVSDEGMDDPWYWIAGSTCVDDGEIVTIPVNSGSALAADVDDLVANIWWYDRNLESGDIDDVDLYLRTTGGTLLNSSSDDWDNKERVYYGGVGGLAVKLEIDGADVISDGEGCGTHSMRVYYSVLIEDDDRDDVDGPAWNAGTCIGVEPM